MVERVERRLARQLPVAAEHLPLIFAAPDRLAEVAGLREAIAGGDAAVGGGHDLLRIGFVAETPEPDQFQLPRPKGELIIAADLVIPAVGIFAHGADAVGQPRRSAQDRKSTSLNSSH